MMILVLLISIKVPTADKVATRGSERKSPNKGSRTGGGGAGIRMSRSSPSLSTSSSSIWRKIKQDSQENHQEHSNRNLETLSDVVSLVVGDGDDSINLQEE